MKEWYLFNWDEIPKNDNRRLIEFLMLKFGIVWVRKAKIEKIDNGMTIRLADENNFLSLKLKNEQTNAELEINDGRTDKFIVKKESGKLNIYTDLSQVCLAKIDMIMGFGNCGRPIIKGDKCIFHLENKTKEEAKIFEKIFLIEFEKMEKNDKVLHFDNFIFPDSIEFNRKIFEKSISFKGAHFIKKVDFSNFIFKYKADFTEVEFHDEADFSEAEFDNEADFWKAQFIKKSNFTWAIFNKNVYFNNAIFCDEVDFGMAKFGNEVIFSETQFDKKADFYWSTFKSDCLFMTIKYNNESFINFRYCKLLKPECVRFHNINLNIFSFLGTDVTEVEFSIEEWAKGDGGRSIVLDESKLKDNDTTHNAVAQLYRRLRRNYEDNYRFAEAGDFFIGEMEMRRLDINAQFKNKNEILKRIELLPELFILNIYKYFSLYGESYFRPAILGFIIIISYPMLMYRLFDVSLPKSDYFLYDYLRTSYTSFFQMDITYRGERIIGILILGLLFIALKRKFERKK